MTDPRTLLHAPLGVPGSGRVRYGAAMALWRAGDISAEVLEVYRVAAAHDGRDPLTTLHEHRLPLPDRPQKETPMKMLYDTARDYLLALDHPGAAEVRAHLPADPGPERAITARRNAVVDRWLEPALQSLGADRPALAEAIAAASDRLGWITYDAYPRAEIGEGFATGHAFASIMGGDAPFLAPEFDLGLFLIAPGVLYRDHHHAAPELYALLTGPHGWRFGPGRPLIVKPAHEPVWNPPYQPHLTKVGRVPFLCLFVWTKDASVPARVLPAKDWAELEALDLG
jgi:hypothetical protein